ncbi:UNVERIFIED_ORG: hypothetical protein QFZ59_001230 [Bacillus sp. B2I3]|nr:hypothetical protein [Bacillus sp. B2I3]
MNLFKRTKKITDERIENVRNKIYKEMFYVILVICLASALFKLYKYGAGSGELYLEFAILVGGGAVLLSSFHFLRCILG